MLLSLSYCVHIFGTVDPLNLYIIILYEKNSNTFFSKINP